MSGKTNRRRLFIMRHAERVDFTFGDWIPKSFDANGKYIRTNLNMPVSVPVRKGGPKDFFKDCPLTNIGHYQATLTGEALLKEGIKFSHVFASPSLRCIQTCDSTLKACEQSDLAIHIEPGLFEWLNWYSDSMPVWLSNDELRSQGFNIAHDYKPTVLVESLTKTSESIEDYYMRSYLLTTEILSRFEGDNILLVGHAATLDTCSRQLLNQAPRDSDKFMSIIYRTPYASITALEEYGCDKWKILPPLLPSGSVQHTANSAYDWEILNT